ncbi:hypothetical protein QR98_0027910 [Sarcoptes scabiei]|uniref:Uncharacterized protein n=1 Tax=Sarcoptes scabiei TaxID=52283 RepID=A0A132A094_SARSC|nr:hypothetical protein QR98_0027910 [Sarcoptes scabiei]
MKITKLILSNGLLTNAGQLVTAATGQPTTDSNASGQTASANSFNTMAAVAAAVSHNAATKLYASNLSKHSLASLTSISNGFSSSKSNKNDRKYAPY